MSQWPGHDEKGVSPGPASQIGWSLTYQVDQVDDLDPVHFNFLTDKGTPKTYS